MSGISREVLDLLGATGGRGVGAKKKHLSDTKVTSVSATTITTGTTALVDDSLPMMIPSKKRLKTKESGNSKAGDDVPKQASIKPARKWVWAPFSNSGRNDGALFNHWVKAGVEYPDYPYARFDVHLDPLVIPSPHYYAQHLQHPGWNRSDTDALLEMCKRLELRWAVIYDEWCRTMSCLGNGDGSDGGRDGTRRLEDLQARYYGIATIVMKRRVEGAFAAEQQTNIRSVAGGSSPVPGSIANPTKTGNSASPPSEMKKGAAAAASSNTDAIAAASIATAKSSTVFAHLGTGSSNREFQISKERERRRMLEKQWNRSKEEEQEEADLRAELKLIDMQIRKLKKSGKHLVLQAHPANAPKSGDQPCTPPVTVSTAMTDQTQGAYTSPLPQSGRPYLQSSRLLMPSPHPGAADDKPALNKAEKKQRIAAALLPQPHTLNKATLKRMNLILAELQVPTPEELQNCMPTKRICDVYDAVRRDILTLLSLQKIAGRKEGEVLGRRNRLQAVSAAMAKTASTGGVPSKVGSGVATSRSQGVAGGGKSKGGGGGGGRSNKAKHKKGGGSASVAGIGGESASALAGGGHGGGKGSSGKKKSTKRKKSISAPAVVGRMPSATKFPTAPSSAASVAAAAAARISVLSQENQKQQQQKQYQMKMARAMAAQPATTPPATLLSGNPLIHTKVNNFLPMNNTSTMSTSVTQNTAKNAASIARLYQQAHAHPPLTSQPPGIKQSTTPGGKALPTSKIIKTATAAKLPTAYTHSKPTLPTAAARQYHAKNNLTNPTNTNPNSHNLNTTNSMMMAQLLPPHQSSNPRAPQLPTQKHALKPPLPLVTNPPKPKVSAPSGGGKGLATLAQIANQKDVSKSNSHLHPTNPGLDPKTKLGLTPKSSKKRSKKK